MTGSGADNHPGNRFANIVDTTAAPSGDRFRLEKGDLKISKRSKSFLKAASKPGAIRARVRLIGSERQIAKEDIDRALKANVRTRKGDEAIYRFVIDHDISFDWLFMGDLRGLRRMRRPACTW